jgi:hypothetical protein
MENNRGRADASNFTKYPDSPDLPPKIGVQNDPFLNW